MWITVEDKMINLDKIVAIEPYEHMAGSGKYNLKFITETNKNLLVGTYDSKESCDIAIRTLFNIIDRNTEFYDDDNELFLGFPRMNIEGRC